MRIPLFLCALLLTSGCGLFRDEPSEEVVLRRHEAMRRACIANQLSQRSHDELQTLQQTTGEVGGTVGTRLPQSAATAALTFARAYDQHAQLRTSAYSQLDSAYNHSDAPADSARHATNAAQFSIAAPEPGSVEANVFSNYEQRFAQIYSDARHPCNWLGQGQSEQFGS